MKLRITLAVAASACMAALGATATFVHADTSWYTKCAGLDRMAMIDCAWRLDHPTTNPSPTPVPGESVSESVKESVGGAYESFGGADGQPVQNVVIDPTAAHLIWLNS